MHNELPTGTVTFLFTDIEGSTRLLHTLVPTPMPRRWPSIAGS
jgi:class 3 adenylate cyclase